MLFVAINVVGVLLASASVAGMIGGSPWFILCIVVGIPLLTWITYRQIQRSNS